MTPFDWHRQVARCGIVWFDPAMSGFKSISVVKKTSIKWYLVTHCDTCATKPVVIFVCVCQMGLRHYLKRPSLTYYRCIQEEGAGK